MQFTLAVAGNTSETVYVASGAYDGNGSAANSVPLPVQLNAQLGSDAVVTNVGILPAGYFASNQWGVYGISLDNSSTSGQLLTITLTQEASRGSLNIYAAWVPVPEPASLWLSGGAGALGLLLMRRQRRIV